MTITSAPVATGHVAGCSGHYESIRRPLVQRHGEGLAIVEAVPLLRCPICADEYMEWATATRLDRIAAAPPQVDRVAPVYLYPEEDGADAK